MKTTEPTIMPMLLGTALLLAVAAVPAADQGVRHHAEGAFDPATSTYQVVKGDDLDVIAERFGVTAEALTSTNKLSSTVIEVGQTLVVAAGSAPTAGGSLQPNTEQTTGAPGSPDATTTIDGRYVPPPQPFQGVIKLNDLQSKPAWPARVVPPKGAPNVLLILIDDEGFGAPSTFGGLIPTPALDKLAADGLRYTNFHTTSLCSPTRGALLTGRNHHSVGFGVISELATGYPGYNSVMGSEHATIAKILKENGYRTSWYGKNHNTPAFETSQAGPFDQWPTGMGFDYFYGFNSGDSSQWEPMLTRNTTPINPFVGNPGYNLITAMADEAIGWMKQLNDVDPSIPFMIYYAPGATHSPHHPTPEWIKKISDMHLFDKGFEAVREQIFANQKKLGVIPPDAKLTPWPKDLIKTWDQHTAEEKKLLIKQADVYAAYLAYTDHETGRVMQAVQDLGKLDNTIIIYINGDNGAFAEGSAMGTWNEVLPFNGINPTAAENMPWYDAWGNNQTYPHYILRLGLDLRYALQVDQADRVVLRRNEERHGDLLAGEDQGQGRHPLAVPPRH